jgi:hypothetical protein
MRRWTIGHEPCRLDRYYTEKRIESDGGAAVLTKHQLRITGNRGEVAGFVERIGGSFPAADLWLIESEQDAVLQYKEFYVDFAAVVPLEDLSTGVQIVAALDDNNHLLRKLRAKCWGVNEVPRAHLLKLWGEGDTAGVVLSFKSDCEGTLMELTRRAQVAYSSLTFRLLWVHWPTSVATHAGAFFPERNNMVVCPRASGVEQFARSLGWLGDYGFNESFYYGTPDTDAMFRYSG